MSAEPFDLRATVRAALDASDDADPHAVVAGLVKNLPARHLRPALTQALSSYVVQLATSDRARAFNGAPRASGSPRWKATALVLRQPIRTDDQWKRLRDCTRDDVLAGATHRRCQADGLIDHAERLEKLAALMDERGVATAGDLGEDTVREVLAA